MVWKILNRGKKIKAVNDSGVGGVGAKGVFDALSRFLRRVTPYISVLVVILILSFWYVDNRYVCEKQMKCIARLERELQDRKYAYLATTSELTRLSRQSVVAKDVESRGLGLRVSTVPVIKMKKK